MKRSDTTTTEKDTRNSKAPSLRIRVWICCLLLGGSLLAMVWVFQIFLLRQSYTATRVSNITTVVDWVRDKYGNSDGQEFRMTAQKMSTEMDVYISVMVTPYSFSFAANPIGRSYGPPFDVFHTVEDEWFEDLPVPTLYLSAFYEAVLAADDPLEPFITSRVDVISGYPMLLYGERLDYTYGDEPNVLVVSAPMIPMQETIRILMRQMIVISLVTVLLTMVIASWISWYISAPVHRLNEQAGLLGTPLFRKGYAENAFRETQEMAQTLVTTQTRLMETEVLRNELIANISHDLRTPITKIRLFAEMIHDFDALPDAERLAQSEIVMKECDRLSEMVQNMLNYSKMKSGAVEYHPSTYEITELVENVLLRYRPLETEEYRIEFRKAEPCEIWAERSGIENVLFNLINNAIHHSSGKVLIEIFYEVTDDRVRVHVKDHGPGIPEEQMEQLWVRYYTGNTTRKTVKTKNIGLGLSIVAATMELHHMPYGCDSKVGEGSDFWFELERVKEDEADAEDP